MEKLKAKQSMGDNKMFDCIYCKDTFMINDYQPVKKLCFDCYLNLYE